MMPPMIVTKWPGKFVLIALRIWLMNGAERTSTAATTTARATRIGADYSV